MRKVVQFLSVLCTIMFLAALSYAGEVTLQWDYEGPTQELQGFQLYYGETSRGNILQPSRPLTRITQPDGTSHEVLRRGDDFSPYTHGIDIPFSSIINAEYVVTVPSLVSGTTYFFSLTAYDHLGNETSFSNEVFATIPQIMDVILPTTPTNLRISLVKDDQGRIIFQAIITP
jgi:hypothetical protein